MARFQSVVAIVLGDKKYRAGQTFADTVGNAQAGDVIWSALVTAHQSPGLIPLDAAGTTLKNNSRFASWPIPTIDGANSVGGG
jgi:hypothetical protein